MLKFAKRQFLWIGYFVFVGVALAYGRSEPLFHYDGPYAAGKYIIWAVLLTFLGYSLYCSSKEPFLKTVPKINQFHWGRQIGLDLYISVFLSLALIFLNEGSLTVMLLWLVPVLIYANLAILLYLALNYGAIVSHFAT